MNAAIARFFDIPELADTLGSHSAKSDVATLVRTCRQFKTLFEPWLYRDLTLCSSSEHNHHLFSKNGCLFRSTHSVRALSRNSHHVRKLTCWLHEIVYFFNCLLRYQAQITTGSINNNSINNSHIRNSTSFAVDQPASTTPPTLPSWVPSPTDPPPLCRLTPLAPMNNLVHLRMNFRPPRYKIKPRYLMSTNQIATTTAARQVCWIIQQSPHIAYLQFDQLSVSSLNEMELLAVTFHGLRWLQEIRLFIRAKEEEVRERGFYKIFFALPVSVSVCKMVGANPLHCSHFWLDTGLRSCKPEDGEENELDKEDGDESSSSSRQSASDNRGGVIAIQEKKQVGEEKEKELDIPEVFCRDEPLSQLKKFRAWDMDMLTNEEVLAVFDHCPNVDSLCVPNVSAIEGGLNILAGSISERCPHLRRLSSRHPVPALATTIMEAMSKQQKIEEVKVLFKRSGFDVGAIRRAFTRHSTTLCKVDFRGTLVRSKDLLAILELCGSLEILIQYPEYDGSDHFITLADAISVPWACKRIRHLEIAIGLDQISLSSEDLPYYQRPAPVTLLEEETRQFADLEMLYREIGGLVHLEYLELHGTYTDDDAIANETGLATRTRNFTFPGMLSIRDDATGRPGYLDLLSGLVKLKILLGSVRGTTDEAKATVGDREMEWIASHWPALERVEFFSSNRDATTPFSRLRDALLPGISLS
ncbi:MAG: hypothetical protein J3R72DRAFT_491384 [Linnemannia gamsii]|nr:MAG: hypothetical protein J3R72DRAFT_491384 [Linnemannia gamsii]